MAKVARSPLFRYGLATLVSTLALLLSLLLWPLIRLDPFLLMVTAVMISSWYGGLGPGLAATCFATLATDYFFLPPVHSLAVGLLSDILRLGVFMAMALLVSSLGQGRKRAEEALRRAHDDLEVHVQERTAELLKVNDALRGEIAERKRAEAQVTESERRYQDLVDSLDGIVWETDAKDFRFTFVSKQCQRLLGYPPERWLNGLRWQDLIHPEDLDYVLTTCGRATEEKRNHTLEYRMIAADGRVLWLRDIATVIVENDRPVKLRGVLLDVTERKQAEEALREQNLALANAMPGISRLDPEGRYVHVNEAYARMIGYEPGEMIGMDWAPTVHPEDRERAAAAYRRMFREGKGEFEAREVRKDGSLFHKHVLMVRRDDQKGHFVGHHCFMRDISERMRAEEALRVSEERLRTAFAHAAVGMALTDLKGRFLHVNPAYCDITGYTEQELLATDFPSITHPDDLGTNMDLVRQMLAGEIPSFVIEKRYITKQGESVWVQNSVSLIRDGEGRPTNIIALTQDITERKQAEETRRALYQASLKIQEPLELQERLNRFLITARDILHLDRVSIFLADPEQRWLQSIASTGTGDGLEAIRVPIGPEAGGMARAYLGQQMIVWDGGAPVPAEIRLKPPYDRIEAFRSRVFAIVPLIVQGRTIGVLGADRKRTRRPLEAATLELLQLFSTHAALAIEQARLFDETRHQQQEAVALEAVAREITSSLDRGEVLQRIVDRARELCGSDLAFLAPYDRETGRATIVAVSGARGQAILSVTVIPGRGSSGKVLETGEPFTTEDYLHDPRISDDFAEVAVQEGFIAQAVVPVRFRGEITGLLWVSNRAPRGFTPREVAVLSKLADQAAIALENTRLYGELRAALQEVEASQQRIVQTERLRALGDLAGGVAHDFNNTLAVILGRTQLLLSQSRDPAFQRDLQVIEQAALDAARAVQRIQEFTRMRVARPFESVDLNRLIDEVVEVTRSRWEDEAQAKGIRYDVRVEHTPLPPVTGDPSELREVLTNLVLNALDAMPGGGRISFQRGINGERVYCVVADTGVGMSEAVRRRVFDPYFTTKGERGSGLGLSVAYGIISRHGGEIEVQSQVGHGSSFTIWLPVGRQGAEALKEPPSPPVPRKGKILVIDDEPGIREVLVDLLSRQGYAVVASPDGPSGLRRFQDERFDLVITDLGMPGLSGWDVAVEVKRRRPEMPIALMTGWGDRIDPEEARAKGVEFLMAKPFKIDDVHRVLARALPGPVPDGSKHPGSP